MDKAGLFITWPQLLYIGVLLILFYVAELLFFWYRHNRTVLHPEDNQQAEQIALLQQEVELLKLRLSAITPPSELAPLVQQNAPDILEHGQPHEETLYAKAIRMAQAGADASQLIMECGLSRAEADLIVAIYRGVYKG
ncbi:DUF2802 domain-containing protein [Chitinibacter sp. S2-10]|uniref:DUF2802 domain-containing protein n=1 Tax=Chitinibacter sp. S2-10 TaxID=3373597 RepID=UPI0039772E5E